MVENEQTATGDLLTFERVNYHPAVSKEFYGSEYAG